MRCTIQNPTPAATGDQLLLATLGLKLQAQNLATSQPHKLTTSHSCRVQGADTQRYAHEAGFDAYMTGAVSTPLLFVKPKTLAAFARLPGCLAA